MDNIHFEDRLNIKEVKEKIDIIRNEIHNVIVGQDRIIDQILTALIANGHILLEGVPGVAKTLLAKCLAKAIDTNFSRIQFTPDLMPSDVLGTSVFDNNQSKFTFKSGPIFSNFILIDEINRSPAKTQAALFEVMEERQVTVDGTTYKMQQPFIVIATQNPVEQEGTYRLPEAQLDRFLFKINIEYPKLLDEVELIKLEHSLDKSNKLDKVSKVVTALDIINIQNIAKQVIVEEKLIEYIAKIVIETRENPLIYLGASPRASIAILNAAKANAVIRGRDFLTPDDIKDVVAPILNHRIIISPDKEMEGLTADKIVKQILDQIELPR